MDRTELYDRMADRKSAPKDFGTYIGDNGRVNRCVQMMKQGRIKTNPKGMMLDVGGGIGDLAFAVEQEKLFGGAVVLDISAKNLEAAKSKVKLVKEPCDVDKQGITCGDAVFDVVTALDFIEHIVDPENFARECYRVLKPGGEVFINTPNIQFWQHIETLISGHMPHTSGDRDVYHGGHLAFFTYEDLREIFTGAGFRGFAQLHDDEGFTPWPKKFSEVMPEIKNQMQYVEACMRFGCPNLLFKAAKT